MIRAARDDATGEPQRVARHHLSKFLLRHDRIFKGATKWGKSHTSWVTGQTFELLASQHVFPATLSRGRS